MESLELIGKVRGVVGTASPHILTKEEGCSPEGRPKSTIKMKLWRDLGRRISFGTFYRVRDTEAGE
jgi:hypothetical protein